MKRDLDLLKDKINDYLNSFDPAKASRLKTEFNWIDGNKYIVLSDVIFIVKE